MTLQDDIARQWFQPGSPPGMRSEAHFEAQRQRPGGPRTTRIAGELPLDEAGMPLPPRPASQPSRLEVTQPYIPAIRDQAPEFLQGRGPAVSDTARPIPAAPPPPPPWRPEPTRRPSEPTGRPTEPTLRNQRPVAPQASPQAPKRRSLARRVIRRIIGPDLLRKDPPKPQRKPSR